MGGKERKQEQPTKKKGRVACEGGRHIGERNNAALLDGLLWFPSPAALL